MHLLVQAVSASQSCLALQWIQPLSKILSCLVQPCSSLLVVLDGLPIILQIAVLNSLIMIVVCMLASQKDHRQLNTVLYATRHAVIPLDR